MSHALSGAPPMRNVLENVPAPERSAGAAIGERGPSRVATRMTEKSISKDCPGPFSERTPISSEAAVRAVPARHVSPRIMRESGMRSACHSPKTGGRRTCASAPPSSLTRIPALSDHTGALDGRK